MGKVADFVAGWDGLYRELGDGVPWGHHDHDEHLLELVELAETLVEVTGSLLDVGCGNGRNSIALQRAGHDTVGLEGSETAIAAYLQRAPEAKVVQGRLPQVPFADRAFNLAIDIGLFHALPPEVHGDYVESLARCIRPGGGLLLNCRSRPDDHPAEVPIITIGDTLAEWGFTESQLDDRFGAGFRRRETRHVQGSGDERFLYVIFERQSHDASLI